MEFDDNTFDCVLDKGTLDALMSSDVCSLHLDRSIKQNNIFQILILGKSRKTRRWSAF